MKKTYSKPTTEVVKMQLENMIALSAEMYGTNATGSAMSRDRGSRNGGDEDDLW